MNTINRDTIKISEKFSVDATVWLYAMGSYYLGSVVRATDKMVEVKYKSGAGVERKKRFNAAALSSNGFGGKPAVILCSEHQEKPAGARQRVAP